MGLALFGPLAVQAAPYIIKFVEEGIKALHAKVQPSPANNAEKLATVTNSTIALLQGLVKTGVIPPLPADQSELAGMATSMVQGVFNNLDANGQLPARPGDPPKPVVAAPAAAPSTSAESKTGGLEIPVSISGTLRFF